MFTNVIPSSNSVIYTGLDLLPTLLFNDMNDTDIADIANSLTW